MKGGNSGRVAREDAVEALAVVIPVHDEEELLGRCLMALARAVEAVERANASHGLLVAAPALWVVLDDCSDASADIARGADVSVITIDASRVGAARSAGVRAAVEAASVPPDRLWIAHTDADSTVPPHWLIHQLALARAGTDVIIGTVRPDFADLSADQTAHWWRRYSPDRPNWAVHGANLGTRASTLLAAGGFAEIAEHEDVRLVAAMRERGARIAASDDAWVQTSGRQEGRTPGGYARYLREDLVHRLGTG